MIVYNCCEYLCLFSSFSSKYYPLKIGEFSAFAIYSNTSAEEIEKTPSKTTSRKRKTPIAKSSPVKKSKTITSSVNNTIEDDSNEIETNKTKQEETPIKKENRRYNTRSGRS